MMGTVHHFPQADRLPRPDQVPMIVEPQASLNYDRNLWRIMCGGIVAAIIFGAAIGWLAATTEEAKGTCSVSHSADVCEFSLR